LVAVEAAAALIKAAAAALEAMFTIHLHICHLVLTQ
jgi:hypothetical protein